MVAEISHESAHCLHAVFVFTATDHHGNHWPLAGITDHGLAIATFEKDLNYPVINVTKKTCLFFVLSLLGSAQIVAINGIDRDGCGGTYQISDSGYDDGT